MRGLPVDIRRNQQGKYRMLVLHVSHLPSFGVSHLFHQEKERRSPSAWVPGKTVGRGGCSLSSRHCYNQQCYTHKILSVVYLPQTVWTLDSLGSGRIISRHYRPIDCKHDDIQVLLPILQPFLSVLYIIPAWRRDLRLQKKGIPFYVSNEQREEEATKCRRNKVCLAGPLPACVHAAVYSGGRAAFNYFPALPFSGISIIK